MMKSTIRLGMTVSPPSMLSVQEGTAATSETHRSPAQGGLTRSRGPLGGVTCRLRACEAIS
jgi:hypothetical protein